MSPSPRARRVARAILPLLAALCLANTASAQRDVGVVIDIEGRWVLGGARELSRGHKLPAGGSISVISPTDYDYIVIANLDGAVMVSRHCRNAGECDRPINLPSPARPRTSVLGVVLDAGMRLLLGDSDEFSRHGSRGGIRLPDATAELRPDGVELGPIFKDMPGDKYYVRLRRLRGRSGGAGWVGPLSLEWGRGSRGLVKARGLRRGLYELDVTDAEGNSATADDYGWVLIAGGREYRNDLSSFAQAEALTRKWGDEVSPEAKTSFLRAYLKHLAGRAGR